MSKTKFVTTIETIKIDGKAVGLVMQDEAGYFYRPKGKSGLHNSKWDGEHFPTVKAVMQSVNGDPEAPQATAEPAKPAKATQGKGTAPKGAKPPAKVPVKEQAKEPAKPKVAAPEVTKPEVSPAYYHATVQPDSASKVRYKLVEALGELGSQWWLYAGYNHAKGFKWNGAGGFMFSRLGDVEVFLFDNGISLTEDLEKVSVSGGYYDPNKGVIPNYVPGQQQVLL